MATRLSVARSRVAKPSNADVRAAFRPATVMEIPASLSRSDWSPTDAALAWLLAVPISLSAPAAEANAGAACRAAASSPWSESVSLCIVAEIEFADVPVVASSASNFKSSPPVRLICEDSASQTEPICEAAAAVPCPVAVICSPAASMESAAVVNAPAIACALDFDVSQRYVHGIQPGPGRPERHQ